MARGGRVGWFVAIFLASLVTGSAVGAETPTYRELALSFLDRPADQLAQLFMKRERLGEIALPSGRLVVADPLSLTVPENEPNLPLALEPGRYAVDFVGFASEETGARVALAQLVVKEGPVRWRSVAGQAFSHTHVLVDAGLASFMSLEAYEIMRERLAESDYYGFVLSREMERREPDVVLHTPPDQKGEPRSLAILHSGFGDGAYPIFEGIGPDGSTRRIAVTFNVMETLMHPNKNGDPERDRVSPLLLRRIEGSNVEDGK